MAKSANWGTIYRLIMAQGRSEKNIEKIKSKFGQCSTDVERDALFKSCKGSGFKSAAQQNKALHGGVDTKAILESDRAHNDDGTFTADDPATPEKNEAFAPPKKVSKGTGKTRVTRTGKKG